MKELRQEIVSYLVPFPPISKDLAFRSAVLIAAISLAVAFIPKLFLGVFAAISMYLLSLILINVVTKFSAPPMFFHARLYYENNNQSHVPNKRTNSKLLL